MQIRVIEILVNHIEPILILPEDTLITMGKNNKHLWLIAEGRFEVYVINNMRLKADNTK